MDGAPGQNGPSGTDSESLEPAITPISESSSETDEESPFRAVGVAAGLGIAGILGLVFVSAVVGVVGISLGFGLGTVFVTSIAAGQYVGFIGLGLFYLRYRGFTWGGVRSYLGLRAPSLRDLGVVVAGYVSILALLVGVVIVAIQFLPEPAENQGAAVAAENPELIPVMILVMFLVVGPAEELLYRGVVQSRLRERLSTGPAIAIATAIFAAVHVVALVGDPSAVAVTVLILFVPGLVFGAVYEYTGNLVVPWLLHSTHNSVILTLIFLSGGVDDAAALIIAVISGV